MPWQFGIGIQIKSWRATSFLSDVLDLDAAAMGSRRWNVTTCCSTQPAIQIACAYLGLPV